MGLYDEVYMLFYLLDDEFPLLNNCFSCATKTTWFRAWENLDYCKWCEITKKCDALEFYGWN